MLLWGVPMRYIILLLCLCNQAIASNTVDFNLLSVHTQKYYKYNNVIRPFNSNNYGIGYSYQASKNLQYTVGFYDNSYYKTTIYGGVRFGARYGVTIVLLTGYTDTPVDKDIRLGVLPNVRIYNFTIGYVPSLGKGSIGYGTLQYNWRI